MKRQLLIGLANLLFILHLVLGAVILTGWSFPQFKYVYVGLLLAWIGCWVILGYCPPTKWEFLLRRKYDKNIDPHAEFIQFYALRFFGRKISSNRILIGGFIIFSILLMLAFTG